MGAGRAGVIVRRQSAFHDMTKSTPNNKRERGRRGPTTLKLITMRSLLVLSRQQDCRIIR